MTYDSLMPHPALYRLWLREQARVFDRAIGGTGAELLIGLSVSREHTSTHIPAAENVWSALAGACAYVRRRDNDISGLALYAAWEATPQDWQLWTETLQ